MNPFIGSPDKVRRTLLASLVFAFSGSVFAQTYPSKPIRLLISFGPGSSSDTVARLITPRMSTGLGQPVILENMTASGGTGAPSAVLRAPADGHTLTMFLGSSASAEAARKTYPYNLVKDFDPISMVASFPVVLAVPVSSPIKSVQDLIKRAKTVTTPITYSSAVVGTLTHLVGELLALESGLPMTSIPYKTPSAGLSDVMTGRVDMLIDNAPAAVAYAKGDKLRSIAVSSSVRNPAFPGVPTLAESFPGLSVDSWIALSVIAGTPKPILDRLTREVHAATDTPEIRQKLIEFGGTVYLSSSEEARKVMAADLEKWRRVIQQSGAKVE